MFTVPCKNPSQIACGDGIFAYPDRPMKKETRRIRVDFLLCIGFSLMLWKWGWKETAGSTDVIARKAKPDMAIPCKFPECVTWQFCADLWRGLPRQCAHWLAMTWFFGCCAIKFAYRGFKL